MLPSNSPSANTRRKMISSPSQNKWGFWSNTPSPSPSPSPTTSPPLPPHPPSPQIDENITKTETGYLFSNGELHWKKIGACYIVRTGIIQNAREINIVYIFGNGKESLRKRYGYFEDGEFIEFVLDA
jgi:hypothetical protein